VHQATSIENQPLTATYSGNSPTQSSSTSSSSKSGTTTSSSSSLNTGAIVGIVIGGLALLLLAGILWALLRRRKYQQQTPVYGGEVTRVEPTPAAPPPKSAAQVSSPTAYETGYGRSTAPPQYSNSPQHYVPPQTETYNPTQGRPTDIHSSELEDSRYTGVAELRGDGTGQ